ncbi:MAG: GNAT family N-acetyltransferase [Ferruginibacter sp.]
MIQDLRIIKLPNEDIAALVNLVNSAYRGEGSKIGWTTEADLLDGIRTDQESIAEILQKPGATILAAYDHTSRMVGCVYLHQQETQLYLGMLTVSPEIQAKGIGKKLLNASEQFGIEMNCTTLTMTVIDLRLELIEWYKRNGYYLTGETIPFPSSPSFGIPKQPLRFVVLEKKISIPVT